MVPVEKCAVQLFCLFARQCQACCVMLICGQDYAVMLVSMSWRWADEVDNPCQFPVEPGTDVTNSFIIEYENGTGHILCDSVSIDIDVCVCLCVCSVRHLCCSSNIQRRNRQFQ